MNLNWNLPRIKCGKGICAEQASVRIRIYPARVRRENQTILEIENITDKRTLLM